jgi:hypothetical protein
MALLVHQGQIDDKAPAQIINLPQGDVDAFFAELAPNLFAVAATQKQRLSHLHHDIVAVPGTGGNQLV